MIKAIQGGLPYGLNSSCLFLFFFFSDKTNHHVAVEQQQNSGTWCSKGIKVRTWPGKASVGSLFLGLHLPRQAGRWQASLMSGGRAPLCRWFLWSVGSQTDPGPDLAPQLFAFWRPATWSLFKWTSCLFFLHIGFSSIWKQNSSPSACFWDRHNCMEDNWRQLNLRKTLLIRSTDSINVCVSSFFQMEPVSQPALLKQEWKLMGGI